MEEEKGTKPNRIQYYTQKQELPYPMKYVSVHIPFCLFPKVKSRTANMNTTKEKEPQSQLTTQASSVLNKMHSNYPSG